MVLQKRKMRALIASGLAAVLPAFVFTVCEVSATVDDTGTAGAGKKVITITFDKQGGFDGTDSVTFSYKDRVLPAITPPVHSVYKFAGYYTSKPGRIGGTRYYDEEGHPVVYAGRESPFPAEDITLYARWRDSLPPINPSSSVSGDDTGTAGAVKEYITITFDKQGGFDGTDSVTVRYGAPLPAIIPPVHSVYKFYGYGTLEPPRIDGRRVYDKEGQPTEPFFANFAKEDITLYAYWGNK